VTAATRATPGVATIARLPTSRHAFTAYLGMVVFLSSWTMMFAGFFFAYALVRSHAPVWPPADQPALPLLAPGINTLVALAGSAALVLALRDMRRGERARPARWLGVAALLGATFLALQAAVWVSLWDAGLRPDGGPYASVFYGLTGIHALHVLVGVVALGALALMLRPGPGRTGELRVRLWGMYWHFVAAVWVGLYLAVYLA